MQLDCYALMLDANGFKSAGYGFLLYFSPQKVLPQKIVEFKIQAIRIGIDINRAKEIVRKAQKCLTEAIPPSESNCEYCQWLKNFI